MQDLIGLPLEEVICELKNKKIAYNIIDNSIDIGTSYITNAVFKDGILTLTISNFLL